VRRLSQSQLLPLEAELVAVAVLEEAELAVVPVVGVALEVVELEAELVAVAVLEEAELAVVPVVGVEQREELKPVVAQVLQTGTQRNMQTQFLQL
jgi:uncharacterized radical SAM superfamily protein